MKETLAEANGLEDVGMRKQKDWGLALFRVEEDLEFQKPQNFGVKTSFTQKLAECTGTH